jgi:hypothetical protein
MNKEDFRCTRCGGTKKLFFEKKPRWLFISAVFLVIVYAASLVIQDAVIKAILIYLSLPLAAVPAIALIRIRCLRCEPDWKNRMWGSGNQ